MIAAYYNEYDPKMAAWLRELIKIGVIANGEVDERSIEDVTASDLRGFIQHHFFAGIGTWSYALRNAGWSDNRPVCTASLPCQPFSVAGNQQGKKDERHLLPHFIELVRQCGFNTIFGEQVEGAIKHGWLDDLQANMEAENYAVGHCVLGAHSVNAAHIRQRLYWVAAKSGLGNAEDGNGRTESQLTSSDCRKTWDQLGRPVSDSRLSGTFTARPQRWLSRGADTQRKKINGHIRCSGTDGIEWLYCRDNKYRPIKSGIKPLVNGLARGVVYCGGEINANNTSFARTIRLKGYGNGINADAAELFISTCMETFQSVQL